MTTDHSSLLASKAVASAGTRFTAPPACWKWTKQFGVGASLSRLMRTSAAQTSNGVGKKTALAKHPNS
eukprot:CAMPEP_0206502422 /NCGR_PEP_ID=MMETSP0324_2-20121206/53990_1 /ASSEMBLY_ACC=CAM_ASM_000836 /TAXON_ID=2866 /ORGANISM="Crypthecodinium cohnii, Strain Seligo" /LENGTH=67 /DNA_ID=CAMNT_0053990617 /DNA_START=587 /DNA_END=790 /DNA_ORIENTATION=-